MKTPVISHHSEECHKCKKTISPGEPRVILGQKVFKCNTCYLTEKYGDTLPQFRATKKNLQDLLVTTKNTLSSGGFEEVE